MKDEILKLYAWKCFQQNIAGQEYVIEAKLFRITGKGIYILFY